MLLTRFRSNIHPVRGPMTLVGAAIVALSIAIGDSPLRAAAQEAAPTNPTEQAAGSTEPRNMPSEAATTSTSGPIVKPVSYNPPFRGAPKDRVGGSTRGGPGLNVILSVLTPESVGLTTEARPVLYWFNSTAVPYPVEVIVTDQTHVEPLLEVRHADGLPAGIHRLDLADHALELQAGVDYRWSVAAVVDPANRSRDVVASGTIRRVEARPELTERLQVVLAGERPAVFAENGIWYEALDTLSRMIAAQPTRRDLRLLRGLLLDQVNLPEAAEFDRRS